MDQHDVSVRTLGGTKAPDTNPKTAFGFKKPPFHFTPPVAEMFLGLCLQNGASRYGLMNWRDDPISSSIYHDAIRRHLAAWLDGEDNAKDSGLPHLGHIMACCAILLDAASLDQLIDDRPLPGKFSEEAAKVTHP